MLSRQSILHGNKIQLRQEEGNTHGIINSMRQERLVVQIKTWELFFDLYLILSSISEGTYLENILQFHSMCLGLDLWRGIRFYR